MCVFDETYQALREHHGALCKVGIVVAEEAGLLGQVQVDGHALHLINYIRVRLDKERSIYYLSLVFPVRTLKDICMKSFAQCATEAPDSWRLLSSLAKCFFLFCSTDSIS